MKEKQIKVIVLEPMKAPRIEVIENKLEVFQHLVGGLVEHLPITDHVDLLFNEEGKMLRLAPNISRKIRGKICDILAGTIVICGYDDKGNWNSLTDEEIAQYMEEYKVPNVYMQVGEDIYEIPLTEIEKWKCELFDYSEF